MSTPSSGFTFRAKLLASYVALVVAVVAVAVVQLDRSLARDLRERLDQRLEQQAIGATQWGVGEGRRHPEKIAARLAKIVGADVTMFDDKGVAVADSRPEPVGEGDVGPEVAAALGGAVGRASRISALRRVETYYVAVRGGDGWVIRLSVPLSDIDATVTGLRSQLLGAAGLALVLALALGLLASRVVARPLHAMTLTARRIANGDFDVAVPAPSPDEFGVLAESLTSLARQLKARIGELVRERDRLSAILEGMAEGVLVVDRGGAIVLANAAAKSILRAPRALEGESLKAALSDADMRGFVEARLADGHTDESEIAATDGRSTAVYVTPLEQRAGAGVVCVLRDMTTIRRVLTMRRDFMANASHELRTPVAAILGYAETLLLGKRLDGEGRQFVEIIERHAKRLSSLVDDVLRLSELEDRPAPSRQAIELGPLVSLVVDTVKAKVERAKVDLVIDVPARLEVLGDSTGLEQVLENLVDNALKYGNGAPIRVAARDDGPKMAVLEVTDRGPGIAAQHLPRLFERFYRVDPARSRERGGSGLGLAIVRQLVESMGGTINVESTVGEGTTFRVALERTSEPQRTPDTA